MMALAVSLLAAQLAVAQDQPAATRVVVDVSGQVDQAALKPRLQAGFGEDFSAPILTSEQALDLGIGPWGVSAPGTLAGCAADPIANAELDEAVAKIEALILETDYAAAQQKLTTIENRLCAANELLSPAVLARIPFLQGVLLAYDGKTKDARAAFLKAVERQPEMTWDDAFPPLPREAFIEARTEAIKGSRTTLTLSATERPLPLYIDGVEIPAGKNEVLLVGEEHFVQGGDPAALSTAVLQTNAARKLELIGAIRFKAGLAQAPTDAEGKLAFGMLVTALVAKGFSEIIVVQEGNLDQVWRWNVIGWSWSQVALDTPQAVAKAGKIRTVGGILLGSGVALGLAGSIGAVTQWDQGNSLQDGMQSDAGLWDINHEEYESHRSNQQAGVALAVTGGVLAAVGIPLLVIGKKQQEAAGPVQASFAVTPGAVAVGVGGRF